MPPKIHFYDAQCIGTPAYGQLSAFDSILCDSGDAERFQTTISLRPDVAFNPYVIEESDAYDLDLANGISEYDWSRKAQALFSKPGTLHVGVANTTLVDHFVRFTLYRCLSTLPHTELPAGAHFLDLLTVIRAISRLRPDTLPIQLRPDWSEQRKREFIFAQAFADTRAEAVMRLASSIYAANPKMMAHAIAHSSPGDIAELCGLVGGQVEGLDGLRPVYICHESVPSLSRDGLFLALATDPQYQHIVYMVDLQADLSGLLDDAGASVSRFIRSEAAQFDRPVLRLNLNRVPFTCPLSVVDRATAARLGIDMQKVRDNVIALKAQSEVSLALMEVSGAGAAASSGDVDTQLFGAEYLPVDRELLSRIHSQGMNAPWDFLGSAHDARIIELANRLIRRCAPALLSSGGAKSWRAHCASRLISRTDPSRIDGLRSYCQKIAGSTAYPQGMRTTASHWLQTTENGNESRSNI